MGKLYSVINAAMPTTAPPTPVTTSTTLYTMLQLKPAANFPIKIVEWSVSFDGSALATPFACELVDTGTVFATVTALAAADVMTYEDPNADANTAGTSGVPLNLGTSASGYTSSAEGTATTCRVFDYQLVDPAVGYCKQFPLGREPSVKAGNCLRVRVKGDGTRKVGVQLVFEV